MSAAHTPGPWSVGPWVDSMGGHVYRVITAAGRKVSSVSVYGKRRDGSTAGRAQKDGGRSKTVSSDECDANALLIAAAPNLLEELECAIEFMESVDPTSFTLRDARVAVAKARGEQ